MMTKKEIIKTFNEREEWVVKGCKMDEAIESALEIIKSLDKGMNSLMISRKKWKGRYFKLKRKEKASGKP